MSTVSHPTSRGSRRSHHEEGEHENHERWLITYGDMLTLLMVLFIVMFAISQVDKTKFAQLKAGLTSGFGAPQTVMSGSQGVLADTPIGPQPLDLNGGAVPTLAARTQAPDSGAGRDSKAWAAAAAQVAKLEQVRTAIEQALADAGLRGAVRFRYDERGLVVSIVTDRVLFPADLATLSPMGRHVLDAIAPVLAPLANSIDVEGHTNTVPVKPRFYPTEWELSSARAVTVVRYLIDSGGLGPARLTATGFADQHPLLPASDPRATRVNRRVEIVVVSDLPPEQRALLPQVAPQPDRL